MTQTTEKFGPDDEYDVLLDTDMQMSAQEKGGRDVVTGCWITHTPTRCSASLSALENTGLLEDTQGGEHAVPLALIEEIAQWAEENGY